MAHNLKITLYSKDDKVVVSSVFDSQSFEDVVFSHVKDVLGINAIDENYHKNNLNFLRTVKGHYMTDDERRQAFVLDDLDKTTQKVLDVATWSTTVVVGHRAIKEMVEAIKTIKKGILKEMGVWFEQVLMFGCFNELRFEKN